MTFEKEVTLMMARIQKQISKKTDGQMREYF
jgi:hypothetical protein